MDHPAVITAAIAFLTLAGLGALAVRAILKLPPPKEIYTVRTVEKFDAEGRIIQTTQTTITKGLS